MMKSMMRQAVPVDVDGGADVHLQPMQDPALQQGKSVRGSLLEEKEATVAMCDELTTTLVTGSPAPLWGRRERIQEKS